MENIESIVMVRALTKREFIARAMGVHGDLYIYSKLEYINRRTKVEIICQKHGSFMKRPDAHVHQKQGCPKCVNAGYSKISIQFLNDLAKDWKVDIQHAENGGEYRIKDFNLECHYKADGYFELDNTLLSISIRTLNKIIKLILEILEKIKIKNNLNEQQK